MKRQRLVWGGLAVLLAAASAGAQPAQRPAPAQGPRPPLSEKDRMRLQIAAMEGVLANAVVQIHSGALEAAMPVRGMITFEGVSRARGFRLDGYGLFFDVDLPPLPRSFAWSIQVLDTPIELDAEIAQLQRQVAAVSDPRLRQQFEQTIRNIRGKVGPATVRRTPGGEVVLAQHEQGGVEARTEDPFKSYVGDLSNALAEVLITYGGTIDLEPNEWLTVAARESQPRVMPSGPGETSITLRVKGADLAAFKAGRIGHEEARKRVEIKEY